MTIAGLPITCIVIAHRPTSVERADIMMTVKEGLLSVQDRAQTPRAPALA